MQTTLLLNAYLLTNPSLRVATASATSQTDLSCRGLTGQASKPYNSIGMHFVLNSSIKTSTDANLPTFP